MKNLFFGSGAMAMFFSIIGGLADIGNVVRNIDRVSTVSSGVKTAGIVNNALEMKSIVDNAKSISGSGNKDIDSSKKYDDLCLLGVSSACGKKSRKK